MGNLIHIVQDRKTGYHDSPAKIRVDEHTIIWRDCAARVVGWLATLGDIAAKFAPSPFLII